MSTCELVSSCEPCAMCLGAIPWSGVRRLVFGADEAAALAAGFDEGDKPHNWQDKFTQRGIEVIGGVCNEQAAEVIANYRTRGGATY